MTDEELRDALDGIYAYDTGAVDSGIRDELLRARCIDHMRQWPLGAHEAVPRLEVSRLVREMWLSEEALAHGYGIEEVARFTMWLCEQMNWGEVFW